MQFSITIESSIFIKLWQVKVFQMFWHGTEVEKVVIN